MFYFLFVVIVLGCCFFVVYFSACVFFVGVRERVGGKREGGGGYCHFRRIGLSGVSFMLDLLIFYSLVWLFSLPVFCLFVVLLLLLFPVC